MTRIAILGNAAGGKSTLARHLAASRDLPLVEIDRMFWNPDWTRAPAATYTAAHARAIAAPRWIIDGVGDMASVKARLARADQVILLDLPLWVHFWRAAERQMNWALGTEAHPPGGGDTPPDTKELFAFIWEADQTWMPKMRALCDAHEAAGGQVIRLTDLEAVDAFMATA